VIGSRLSEEAMPEQTAQTLNHFGLYSFTEAYWSLDSQAKSRLHQDWLGGLREAANKVDIYQLTDTRADVLAWCAVTADEQCSASSFFEGLAKATTPHRRLVRPVDSLWGFTRPSQYTKARSAQEIDPFAATRKQYLVAYPFSKTAEWYLMSRESRQGMMNEHIRIGKQYEEIQQLLLYSFGLQDQEFVVVYETDDLRRFSDLVNELRDTEARRYTLRDTPVYTAVYHPAEETLALWR
jgi:chlorite dismutase